MWQYTMAYGQKTPNCDPLKYRKHNLNTLPNKAKYFNYTQFTFWFTKKTGTWFWAATA